MAHNNEFIEHRRYERRSLRTLVAVFSDGQFTIETSAQISEGGMLLKAGRAFSVGEKFEFNFFIPGGRFVNGIGEVAYVIKMPDESIHMGVRFVDPSNTLRREIRGYIGNADY